MDSLTARSQPDYWALVKQRYLASQTQYARLAQDWAKASGQAGRECESTQQRLAELESLVLETGKRLERRNRAYEQQREPYEVHRQQRFAELQAEAEPNADRFYADTQVNVGLKEMDVTLRHVLVTLEAYARREGPASMAGLSSVEGLEDYVKLVDAQGQDLGMPQEVQYDRLPSVNGLIVTLAFAHDPATDRQPARLLIEPSPLGNQAIIALQVPPAQEKDRVARALEQAVLLQSAQSEETRPEDGGIQVIRCERQGRHLKVPVELDIHGVTVRTVMLLDTGASITVLAKSAYTQGLARPFGELQTMRLKTANGLMVCPVDTLEVSTAAFTRTMPVALTDRAVSLLGADYFAGHSITLDLDRACIYVHPKAER